MIFVTGDIHGNTERFSHSNFKAQKHMTKNDYVIVLGDFGVIWDYAHKSTSEKYRLDELNNRSFTTLFIDGNHENFNRLNQYPVVEWNGGKVHQIRDSIFHLMRGEVFNIDGYTFYTFGGAASHDIEGLATKEEREKDYTAGILQIDDPNIHEKTRMCKHSNRFYRIEDISWWREEMPSLEEMEYGLSNLEKSGNQVDFVLTHDAPSSFLPFLIAKFDNDKLNRYLETVRQTISYKNWYFGHHHKDMVLPTGEECLYHSIKQIG